MLQTESRTFLNAKIFVILGKKSDNNFPYKLLRGLRLVSERPLSKHVIKLLLSRVVWKGKIRWRFRIFIINFFIMYLWLISRKALYSIGYSSFWHYTPLCSDFQQSHKGRKPDTKQRNRDRVTKDFFFVRCFICARTLTLHL